MGKLMSLSGVQPITLSQTTGPGSPRTFRVLPFEDVVLGRDEDCAIVLDEEPVSRKHAKLLYHGSQPELLDLGSTNGTFLNGKRVHRGFLTNSSRFQVGSSNFVVEAATDVMIESPPDGLASLLRKSKNRSTPSPQQASAISGRLSELRLPSLLQMIESDRATGTLVILHGGQEGKPHIHQGAVRHASLERASGLKALYRLMALDEGGFEFYISGRNPGFDTVEGDMQRHLLEAMRQKDELSVYKKRLPRPEVRLNVQRRQSHRGPQSPSALFGSHGGGASTSNRRAGDRALPDSGFRGLSHLARAAPTRDRAKWRRLSLPAEAFRQPISVR